MVQLFTLAGGALALGLGFYKYLTHSVRTPMPVLAGVAPTPAQHLPASEPTLFYRPRQLATPQPLTATLDPIPRTQETQEALQHDVRTSAVALGLISASLLFLPPLQYASIPALIYMGAPAARQAYDTLAEEGRPSRALAETTVLAICLGGGWYLAGSLGFWLYYLGRLRDHKRHAERQLLATTWAIPAAARRRNGTDEIVVPTQTLQRGEQILVESSEFIPVDGVIVEGVALVQPKTTTDPASCRLMRTGDRVLATDLVIAGRLALMIR